MNNKYNAVLIIIYLFRKEKYKILFIIDKNNTIVKITIYLLFNYISKFHNPFLLLIFNNNIYFLLEK